MDANQILVLDVATLAVSGIAIPASVNIGAGRSGRSNKWSAGAVVGGKVFGIPHAASQIMVLDHHTGVVSGIKIPSSVGLTTEDDRADGQCGHTRAAPRRKSQISFFFFLY